MNGMLIVFLLLNLLSGIFVYLGYLIAFRNRRDLISGYREGEYKEPEKFGKLMGISLFFSAVINLAISIALVMHFEQSDLFARYGALIVAPPLIAALYGNIKYRH